MAFSGFLGVLIGHDNLLLVVMAALWGFGLACLPHDLKDTAGWVNSA